MKHFLVALFLLFGLSLGIAADDLAAGFAAPPPDARPWVYWFWCNGNITKAGITADLEAMHRVGIGGVLIMEVGVKTPAGSIQYGSPEWHEMLKFTFSEAARLGLKVNMTNAPGWCGSGGPWITPELSEQKLTWTETHVNGPATISQTLPRPAAVDNYYADVALLAYPTPGMNLGLAAASSPAFSIGPMNSSADSPALGADGVATLPRPRVGMRPYVQDIFTILFTARTAVIQLRGIPSKVIFRIELESSEDGVNFTPVGRFSGNAPEMDLAFDAVTARAFRAVFIGGGVPGPDHFSVSGFRLSPAAGIEDTPGKTLASRVDIDPTATYPILPPGLAIESSRVLDLTSKMDAQGHLAWKVPDGHWTLLRLGHTSHGVMNHPAPEGGLGLECDKLSRRAVDAHFAGLMQKVIQDAGPLTGHTLTMMHIDSWETGTQNWTPKFREEFQARRGYDLLNYLPAMAGQVVDSPEVTERFLWDFRQTAAELLAENYAGHMEELAHAHGLRLSIEAYGNSLADDLTYGARADEPMCEFWRVRGPIPSGQKSYKGNIEMPSVAHVYGKSIVGSEAFTSNIDERWLDWPGSLKAMGDWAFCMGINRLVFHRYAMQPWLDQRPGMSMGPYGVHYERTETWWNDTAPWHQYLSRCQYLLQKGLTVADICYVNVERAPNDFVPPLPNEPLPGRPGYNYDYAPAEAVINRFSVKNGRVVLPDGMSYRVLVLPNAPTMTPALLRKVKQLVADGATVIGTPPEKSPSLSNYPACDTEIKSLVGELWGRNQEIQHVYGKGRIVRGEEPNALLAQMGVVPDFSEQEAGGIHSLLYIHHLLGATDAYFVANKTSKPVDALCNFRVNDRRPEFWWPETGQIEPAALYDKDGSGTRMPIHLDPTQSVFVVFRAAQGSDHITNFSHDGQPISSVAVLSAAELHTSKNGVITLRAGQGGRYQITRANGMTATVTVPQIDAPIPISGRWNVSFSPGGGAPALAIFDCLSSWSDNADNGVKYFSGTGTYRKTITLPPDRFGEGRRLYLDLGDVENIANVTLNGKPVATLWKAPYVADLTGMVHPGENDLEIAVTNLWPNRMIGDQQLPPDSARAPDGHLDAWPTWLTAGMHSPSGRFTFTSWELWHKTEALLPSGLLGPVTLRSAVDVPFSKPH